MSKYAINVLLSIDATGKTDEATKEFDTWEELSDAVRALDGQVTSWQAITIIHVEDFPRLMQDAVTT